MAAETSPDTAPPTSPDLAGLRTRIDQLDAALIAIVAERLAICREVAAVKEGSATPVIQPARVRDVVTSRRQQAIEPLCGRPLISDGTRVQRVPAQSGRSPPAPSAVFVEHPLVQAPQ